MSNDPVPDNWTSRIVLGIHREADGETIKISNNGEVRAYLPGHDITLFTAEFKGSNEGGSGLPETSLPIRPEYLMLMKEAEPVDLGELHAKYS